MIITRRLTRSTAKSNQQFGISKRVKIRNDQLPFVYIYLWTWLIIWIDLHCSSWKFVYAWPMISHLDHIWWWWWVVRIYREGNQFYGALIPMFLWWKRSIFSSKFLLDNCELNDSHRRRWSRLPFSGNYFSDEKTTLGSSGSFFVCSSKLISMKFLTLSNYHFP